LKNLYTYQKILFDTVIANALADLRLISLCKPSAKYTNVLLSAELWEKVTVSEYRSQGKTGTKAIKEMAGISIRISFK
jgi:hypothetical protein